MILDVVQTLEGAQEIELVRHLLRLRDGLVRREMGDEHAALVAAARAEVINIVNNFFDARLTALPPIKQYMDKFAA